MYSTMKICKLESIAGTGPLLFVMMAVLSKNIENAETILHEVNVSFWRLFVNPLG